MMTADKRADKDEVQGEGDYRSARTYKRDIDNFIQKKDREIPEMAKEAEKAMEGPEKTELEQAEQKGESKARH